MNLSRQRIATLRAIQARKREYALVSSLTANERRGSDSSDVEDYYYNNNQEEDDEDISSTSENEQKDYDRDFASTASSWFNPFGNPGGNTSVTSTNNERKPIKKAESIISDGKNQTVSVAASATSTNKPVQYIHPSETDETRDVILNFPSPGENSIHNQVIREFWERYEIASHNRKNKVCRQAIAEMVRRGVRFLCSEDYANRALSGRRKSEELVEIDPIQSHRVLLRVTRALRKEVVDRIQQMKPKQRQEHEAKMEALREKERQRTNVLGVEKQQSSHHKHSSGLSAASSSPLTVTTSTRTPSSNLKKFKKTNIEDISDEADDEQNEVTGPKTTRKASS
jgi:hypothetical protein